MGWFVSLETGAWVDVEVVGLGTEGFGSEKELPMVRYDTCERTVERGER